MARVREQRPLAADHGGGRDRRHGPRAHQGRAGGPSPGSLGELQRRDQRTARARRVPCELIIATICTESGGKGRRGAAGAGLRLRREDAAQGHPRPDADADLDRPRGDADELRPRLAAAARERDRGGHGVHRQSRRGSPGWTRRWSPPPTTRVGSSTGRQGEPLEAAAVPDRHREALRPLCAVLQRRRGRARRPREGSVCLMRLAGGRCRPRPTGAGRGATSSSVVAFAARAEAAAVTEYSVGVVKDILRTAGLKRGSSPAPRARRTTRPA